MKLVNIHIHKWMLAVLLAALFGNVQAQVWSLQQCLDTAQAYNKNLLISKNNIAISQERYKEAQSGLAPKINVNADYRYYTSLPYQLMPMSVFGGPEGQYKEAQFGVPHNLNANVQIAMPLYNPQVNGAMRTTRIAAEMSELQKQKTEEEIFFEISNAYYNAQILNSQLEFVQHNLENANDLLSTIRLLNEQLMAKGTDVSKVALQVDQLKTKKELLKNQYELVLNSLKFSMGVPLETNVEVERTIEYRNADYADQPMTDIRMAQTQHRLISVEVNTLKNSRLPVLSLFGTFGTTGFGYDTNPGGFFDFYPIGFAGVQFTYPLFNGMATKRKINQKNLELSNTELTLDVLIQQNTMQADNARKQKVVAEKTIENTLSQVTLAQSIYDQTVLQQKHGTATLTDILIADNSLQEAQQAHVTAVVEYLKADLALKKLTGNILTR